MSDYEEFEAKANEALALQSLRRLVDLQANDLGLWSMAQTATEDYLQRALRVLHAAVEEVKP